MKIIYKKIIYKNKILLRFLGYRLYRPIKKNKKFDRASSATERTTFNLFR